jgi:hypothetical protein
MVILDNGQVHVNGETLLTPKATKPFDLRDYDTSKAPFVVAKFDEIVMAPIQPGEPLFTVSYMDSKDSPKFQEQNTAQGGYVFASANPATAKEQFSQLLPHQLILKKADTSEQLPVNMTAFLQSNPVERTDTLSFPANSVYEDKGNGHHIKRSGAMRILQIKDECTVGTGTTTELAKPGDWLLVDEKTKIIKLVSRARMQDSTVEFFLAAADGTILSNSPLTPDAELPALRDNEKSRGFLSRFKK